MSQTTENGSPTGAELDLSFTQNLRKKLIGELVKKTVAADDDAPAGTPAVTVEGEVQIPNESSEKTMLIQLLDGVDRQALGRMKVEVEKEASNGQNNANAALIATLITGGHLKDHAVVPGAGRIPTLPADTPPPDLIPGQLGPTGSAGNWKEFEDKRAIEEGRAPAAPTR